MRNHKGLSIFFLIAAVERCKKWQAIHRGHLIRQRGARRRHVFFMFIDKYDH